MALCMGCLLSPVPVTLTPTVFTILAYQATSKLCCLSDPDSPIVLEYSAASTSSAMMALSRLTTQVSQLLELLSTLHIALSIQLRLVQYWC